MDAKKALKQLTTGKSLEIDTFNLNGRFAVNVAGLGFDAQVAHAYTKYPKRGLISYIKAMLKTYHRFRPINIRYTIDGVDKTEDVFLLSIANSQQFGNNAFIAPLAKLNDGLLDISILKPYPIYAAPSIALLLVTKRIHKSKYYVGYQTENIHLSTKKQLEIHIDGEALHSPNTISANISIQKLRIICGM